MMAYAREMLFPSEGKGWGRGDADALDPLEQGRFCSAIPFPRLRGAEVFEGYGVAMLLAPDQVIQL